MTLPARKVGLGAGTLYIMTLPWFRGKVAMTVLSARGYFSGTLLYAFMRCLVENWGYVSAGWPIREPTVLLTELTRNWIVFSWSHTRIWPKGLTAQAQCLPQTRQHFSLYDSCRAFFRASCCVLGFPFIREQGEKCIIPTVCSDCSLVVGCPLREGLPLAHPSHSSCRQFILTNTWKLGNGKWKLQK